MSDSSPSDGPAGAATREERLAARLRENLRRRKAQARELTQRGPGSGQAGPAGGDARESGPGALSKPQGEG